MSESIPATGGGSGVFSVLDWIGRKVGPADAGQRVRGALVVLGVVALVVWFRMRAKK